MIDCSRYQNSCFYRFASSKPILGVAIATGIALTILGGLSIAGVHNPISPLGALRKLISAAGAYSITASGVSLLGVLALAKCLCKKEDPYPYHLLDNDREFNGEDDDSDSI